MSIVSQAEKLAGHSQKLLGLLGENIPRLSKVSIEDSPERGLDEAYHWLHSQGKSLVLYFGPHTTSLDPVYITNYLVRDVLKPGRDKFGWVLSAKFGGEIEGLPDMGLMSKAYRSYQKRMGFVSFPIAQPRHLQALNPAAAKKGHELNTKSLVSARNFLASPGNVLGVAPEGTRSQAGGFLRAEQGIDFLVNADRGQDKIAFLPVHMDGFDAIQPEDKTGFAGLNPFREVRFQIGPYILPSEVKAMRDRFAWKDPDMGKFTLGDTLMMHLADRTLSPWRDGVDPRGVYARENITQSI